MLANRLSIFLSATALTFVTLNSLITAAHADDAPAINASGAGMTNEQLLQTRPILSGLKAVNDCQQSLNEIKDKAQQMVSLCTNQPGDSGTGGDDFYGTSNIVTGGNQQMDGKFFKAPRFKLVEIDKSIIKQMTYIAQTMTVNQQDKRTLRAAEKTRDQVEGLRTEARATSTQLFKDSERVTTMLSGQAFSQSALVDACKSLIGTCSDLQGKLKKMEKVMKREMK